jgi:hypothetical protein
LASLGKSRKAVVVPTPPVDVPLTTNVTSFKVHIRSTQGLPSADVEPTKAHFDPERDRLMLFSDSGWPVSLCQLGCGSRPSVYLEPAIAFRF